MDAEPRVNEDNSISLSVSSALSIPDEGFQWDTVHVEAPTQLTFDNVGDVFIGLFVGREDIQFTDNKGQEQEFQQLNFLVNDEPFAINAGFDLKRGFKGIADGTMVRIQLRKLVDVGQRDMLKSYRVDVAKPAAQPVTRRAPRDTAQAMAERVTGVRDTARTQDDQSEIPF